MNNRNKNLKEDAIVVVTGIAIFLGLGALVGYNIDEKNDFKNRVDAHTNYAPKHNRWHNDEMAANVAALQDSTLLADFNHYRDLSHYFTGALLKYSTEKKAHEFAASTKSDFPIQYANPKKANRFEGIRFKQNGDILDSLDNCVKKLDARYDYLTQQRKSNQR